MHTHTHIHIKREESNFRDQVVVTESFKKGLVGKISPWGGNKRYYVIDMLIE